MSAAKDELVRSWLIKAHRDLLSARELAEATSPLLDTAAYHCQQAAEKAIKGYLLFHDVRFEKSHDIELLVGQASAIDRSFSVCVEAARLLTPLAVEYRYPGDYIEPEPEEFQEAFDTAQGIFDFVVSKLPERFQSVAPVSKRSNVPWIVTEVIACEDFTLQVRFVDGLQGRVEMKGLIHGSKPGVFAALADPALFAKVYLEYGAVTWPGEIDLAPDAMHEAIKAGGVWVV
jgi:HEPN domain-containing protein